MKKKYSLFVLLQVFVLLYMAGSHFAIDSFGSEVKLKTAPVDPRDILFGDYVILNYEISNIEMTKFQDDKKPKRGDAVYVLLERKGEHDQLVSAHLNKPSPSVGEKVLKGRIDHVSQNWVPDQGEDSHIQSVHVVYGIERYYIPEGTGKELEDKRGQFDVVVKVAPWGHSISSISFIATGVMTQWEAQEIVYQHFNKRSLPIDVVNSHLVNRYKGQERAVWMVEVRTIRDKMYEQFGEHETVAVDAKTGEILEQGQP